LFKLTYASKINFAASDMRICIRTHASERELKMRLEPAISLSSPRSNKNEDIAGGGEGATDTLSGRYLRSVSV